LEIFRLLAESDAQEIPWGCGLKQKGFLGESEACHQHLVAPDNHARALHHAMAILDMFINKSYCIPCVSAETAH
jgi:hypothetical protein